MTSVLYFIIGLVFGVLVFAVWLLWLGLVREPSQARDPDLSLGEPHR